MSLLSRIRNPASEEPAEQEDVPRPRQRLVGEILRDRREELGLDLDSIGEALRIKPSYLAALEQGHSDELPGPAYAIGFVRAYARHLGFNSEKVLARLRAESSALQTRPDLSLPVPLGERSLPGTAVLVVALILALCGYGTWYYLSTGEHSRPERVAEVPAALRSPAPDAGPDQPPAGEPARQTVPAAADNAMPIVTPPAVPPTTAAAPVAVPDPRAAGPGVPKMISGLFGQQDDGAPGAAATPAAQPSATMAATTPAPIAADAASTTSPPAETLRAAPASAGSSAASASRIAITATSDCWIQVRGPDQVILFSRVLKQGETYQVPAKPGLAMRTGNAGALQIAVDGKPAPSIGTLGTLRRNVALDPDALLGGTAVHG